MELTRINNDVNGNPRYVVHFLDIPLSELEEVKLANPIERDGRGKVFMDNRPEIERHYEMALKKAKTIGGRKFHNKQYGGGIVFQSYNTDQLLKDIAALKNS